VAVAQAAATRAAGGTTREALEAAFNSRDIAMLVAAAVAGAAAEGIGAITPEVSGHPSTAGLNTHWAGKMNTAEQRLCSAVATRHCRCPS
jgi:hypothetical protein